MTSAEMQNVKSKSSLINIQQTDNLLPNTLKQSVPLSNS